LNDYLHVGIDTTNLKAADAGLAIADKIINLLARWKKFVPDGLKEVILCCY
jgi:hypothetical protein